MAVKIRLKRFGKKKAPFYRVVVLDGRTKRDGRAIEEIGIYHPLNNPSVIEIDGERARYWLSVGAQPSDQVRKLLTLTGDWGIFKGEKGATSTVEAQPDKLSPEERIKETAIAAEKAKALKAAEREVAAKKAADEAAAAEKEAAEKAAAEAPEVSPEAEAAPAEEAPAAEAPAVADESSEVPADEGTEVKAEIAEGKPSDADDKVEGVLDEAAAAEEAK